MIYLHRTAALHEFSALESKRRGSRGGPVSLTRQERIGSPKHRKCPCGHRVCLGRGKVTYESVPMPRTSRLGRWGMNKHMDTCKDLGSDPA